MMSAQLTLEEAFRAHLLAAPSVSARCGSRIHISLLPQLGTVAPSDPLGERIQLPAITVTQVSGGEPFNAHRSVNGYTERARIQIDVWAHRTCESSAVMAFAVNALRDFTGIMGGPGGVKVGRCALTNKRNVGREGQSKIWRWTADFYVLAEVVQ